MKVMAVNSRINTYPSFCGENDERNNELGKAAITSGGAVAGASAISKAKNAKSAFGMFSSAKNFNNVTKIAANAGKKAEGIWPKVVKNAKWAKESILKWGAKFKESKYIAPIVKNRLFKGVASTLGFGFGIVTFLSCCADIGKTAADTYDRIA